LSPKFSGQGGKVPHDMFTAGITTVSFTNAVITALIIWSKISEKSKNTCECCVKVKIEIHKANSELSLCE
jgi:hypothetical protein